MQLVASGFRRKLSALRLFGLVAGTLAASASLADEPMLTYRYDDHGKIVQQTLSLYSTNKKIDSIKCKLLDFQPHEATVHYMLNFAEPVKVQKVARDGTFWVKGGTGSHGSPPPFLEGMNTLSIISKNRVGLSNRQTIIIQMLTTPIRVDVVWPWVSASIKESAPTIKADITPIYAGTTLSNSSVDSIKVNGKNLVVPEGVISRIGSTESYRFSMELPAGHVIARDPDGTPHENRIQLYITANVNGGTSSFSNHWFFLYDTTAPTVRIFAPPFVSAAKESDMQVRLRFDDDISLLVRDVRVLVKNADGAPVCSAFVPWQSRGEATIDLPLTKTRPLLWRILLFWKKDDLPLVDGTYTMEVRCRDMALLGPEHVEHENAYQSLSADQNPGWKTVLGTGHFANPDIDAAKKYFNEHFDPKADPRFNVGEDKISFTVDSKAPAISDVGADHPVFTSAFAHLGKDTLITRFAVDEPAWIDLIYRRKSSETDTRWVVARRKQFRAIDSDKKDGINEKDTQSDTLSFTEDFHLMPDGVYDLSFTARDSAGNEFKSKLFPNVFTIDRTGPEITKIISPDFVLDDGKIAGGATLSFRAYDMEGQVRKALLDPALVQVRKRGSSLATGVTEVAITNPDSFEYSAPPIAFPKKQVGSSEIHELGAYDLFIEARDHYVEGSQDISNRTMERVEFIYGGLPPKITYPLPFAEITGITAIKGNATDPNLINIVPFWCFELTYAPYNPATKKIDASNGWRASGMTVPELYGHAKSGALGEMFNSGAQEVTEGKLLGHWDARLSGIDSGYYAIRLLAREVGDSGIEGPTARAYDTVIVYVSKYDAPELNPSPNLSISAPASVVDFTEQRYAPIDFRLSDPTGRSYSVRVGVRSGATILRDTVFTRISSGGFVDGKPSATAAPGLLLWSEGDLWHVRWNGVRARNVPCKGVLQGNGNFSVADSGRSQVECTNNAFAEQSDVGLLSMIAFGLEPGSEIVFTTTSSKMDLNVLSDHDTIQFLIGKNLKSYKRDELPIRIASGSKVSQWKWSGLDALGTYPPPGTYAAFAIADAEDGMATTSAVDSFEIRTPFGVEIDRLSSGHFYRDNTNENFRAKPDSITAWYKLRCDARVTAEILDKDGAVIQTVMRDSLQTGRGQKAKLFPVSWNGNSENELVDANSRFRFRITAAAPTNSRITVSDTSDVFLVYSAADIRSDATVAKLDVEYDSQVDGMNLVGGGKDLQWMAQVTGKAYPERKIPFKLAISGMQAAATGTFQRHTVKMRRYFDTLEFRIYAFIEGEKKHERTFSGDNSERINEWIDAGTKYVLKSPDGFTLDLKKTVGPLNKDGPRVHWWWVERATAHVFVVPPWIGFAPEDPRIRRLRSAIDSCIAMDDAISSLMQRDTFIAANQGKNPELLLSLMDTAVHEFAVHYYPQVNWGDGRDSLGKSIINWDIFHSRLGGLKAKIVSVLTAKQAELSALNPNLSFMDNPAQAIDTLRKVAWREFSIDLAGNKVDTVNVWKDINDNSIVDYDSQEVFRDFNGNKTKDGNENFVDKDTSLINSDIEWMASVYETIWSDRDFLGARVGNNGVNIVSSLEINPRVWANIYGRNNLVSRYSTWDSENSLYYDKSGGLINKDKYSNDYDSDADNVMQPWDRGGAPFTEGERRYSSLRHHQKLMLKRTIEAPESNGVAVYGPPLKFFSLEEHAPLNAVKGEHWQFWLEGHPDSGTYQHFRLSHKKASREQKSVISGNGSAPANTITIDGPVAPEDILEVWPEGIVEANSATWDSVQYPLSWEQYCALNDWKTEQGSRMFKRLPPGAKRYNEDPRQKTLVPTPSLKLLEKDRQRFQSHFDSLGLPTDSTMFVSDTIRDTVKLIYDNEHGYAFEYKIPMALGSNASIRSVRVIPDAKEPDLFTQYLDASGDVIDAKTSNRAVASVRFSLSRQPAWSTDDDSSLQYPGDEIYDGKDNNGNIAVDENAYGTLQSGAIQYGDSRGFRMRKRMYFHEGYPCQGQSDTNAALFICKCEGDKCSHKGNDRVKVESWKVSVRDIAGKLNPDYEVIKVYNDPNNATGSYFVASLKDDVFFPRRLVPIHGRAFGKSYRIYFRNGSGWDRIAEVTNPDRNDASGHRLLGFWDVTGLNGRYSLVLEVFDKDNKPVQDEITVHVGQYADDRTGPCVLMGQNGRSRLTLSQGSLPNRDPEKRVVTFSAVHLNEIGLSKRPQFNPVGPVLSVLPSIPSFPPGLKPKAEIFFTGKECQKNNWLHTNFAFYSINADSGILQPVVSLPTYLFADTTKDFTPDSLAIPNPDSFAVLVESGRDCFMKITGELNHWSNYVVKERTPRLIYADISADMRTANGESWNRAYPTIAMAITAALPGDSILIAAGVYQPGFKIPAGIHLRGGFDGRSRKWDPAQHPSIIRGNGASAIEAGEGSSIEGFKLEGFSKALLIKSGHVWISRSLFLNNGTAIDVQGGQSYLQHVTIRSAKTGITLSGGRIVARNTIFDCPTDIIPRTPSRIDLSHCRVAKGFTNDSLNTSSSPAFKDGENLCRLSGGSMLIDAGKNLGLPYLDEAPDIGWHEYVGDSLYVNETLPIGQNDGSSWANALTGRDGLARAVRVAGAHDRVLVAAGEYSLPPSISKYLVIRGGFDTQGRGIRNPIQNVTRIQGPVRVGAAGAAISGIRVEKCAGPGIIADSSKALRVENSVFSGCLAGISGRAKLLDVRYSLFVKCQSGVTIVADSGFFMNNTIAYGVDGISGTARASNITNNIFFNLSQASIGIRPKPAACLRNCFFEAASPDSSQSGITNDPQFINPAGDNFFLDRSSPCVNAGTDRRHIGALGPGTRPARREIVCLRAPAPIRIDGTRGNEWDAYPAAESGNLAPSCGKKAGVAPAVQASFAYDPNTLYGFATIQNVGNRNCELWLVLPKDTIRVHLFGRPGDISHAVRATEVKYTTAGNTARVEFALSFKNALRISPPRDGEQLPFNFRLWEDSVSYLWNGDAGCVQPPASYDRIRFSDQITPRILISNVKRHNNAVVEPRVEFQYMTSQMRSAIELDGDPFRNGTRIYAEGRHRLEAKVTDLAGRSITKTETSFVVDFTPPVISVTDVPSQKGGKWLYNRGPVPVTEDVIQPRIDVSDRYGVKSLRTKLNGASYPRIGFGPLRDGQYRLEVSATDSSGNTAEFETDFIVDRVALLVSIISPRQGTSTRDSVIDIEGRVNPAGARVQVKGATTYTVTDDTTFTLKNVPIEVGNNRLEIVAYSTLRKKWSAPETLLVIRDTLSPTVEFIAPQPYDTINGTIGNVEDVEFRVRDNVDSISQMHFSVPGGVVQRVRGDTVEAKLVMINESMNYLITASATDRAGNKGLAQMRVIFGMPPVITIAQPGPYSGTNDTTVVISGTTNDSNTTHVTINGLPVDFFDALTDSFRQTVHVREGNDSAYGVFNNLNRFVIRANDAAGFSDVETLFVAVDRDTPNVNLVSPANDSTVTNEVIRISGTLDDPFANVAVGSDTLWQAGATFYIQHKLVLGLNNIYLTAWDSVGNKTTSDTVSVFYAPPESTIYVNGTRLQTGNGTQMNPYKTIAEAAAAALPGRTVLIAPTTYSENASFGSGVKIVGPGVRVESAASTAMTLSHSTILQGITFVHTGPQGGIGVRASGSGVSIQGCTFQNFDKSIEAPNAHGLSISGCRSTNANTHISLTGVNGGRITQCDLRNGTTGITMTSCSLSVDHNIITGASLGIDIQNRSAAGRICFNTFANCLRGISITAASPRIDQNILSSSTGALYGIAKDAGSAPVVERNDIWNHDPVFDEFGPAYGSYTFFRTVPCDTFGNFSQNPQFADENEFKLGPLSSSLVMGEGNKEIGRWGVGTVAKTRAVSNWVWKPVQVIPLGFAPTSAHASQTDIVVMGKGALHLLDPNGKEQKSWQAEAERICLVKGGKIMTLQSDRARLWDRWGSSVAQFAAPAGMKIFRENGAMVLLSNGKAVKRLTAFGPGNARTGSLPSRFENPEALAEAGEFLVVCKDSIIALATWEGRVLWSRSVPGVTKIIALPEAIALLIPAQHKIVLWDYQGNQRGTIGELGSSDNAFHGPCDISATTEGFLVVSDAGNNRISIWGREGSSPKVSAEQDSAAALDLTITNPRFVPSPYVPSAGPGYFVFQLSRSASIKVRVLDANGRPVRTLDFGLCRPGKNRLPWDGRNGQGTLVISGPYLYIITAEDNGRSCRAKGKFSVK